ncbi:MAG: hypothetical protein JOZ29_21990 [Deltaproteobacteria bacterium]|nr:hypothetical protein [Deltaproteobacteria bacterium]
MNKSDNAERVRRGKLRAQLMERITWHFLPAATGIALSALAAVPGLASVYGFCGAMAPPDPITAFWGASKLGLESFCRVTIPIGIQRAI